MTEPTNEIIVIDAQVDLDEEPECEFPVHEGLSVWDDSPMDSIIELTQPEVAGIVFEFDQLYAQRGALASTLIWNVIDGEANLPDKFIPTINDDAKLTDDLIFITYGGVRHAGRYCGKTKNFFYIGGMLTYKVIKFWKYLEELPNPLNETQVVN